MLQLACPMLRRLEENRDPEKYTAPLLKSWEGTFPRIVTSMRKTQEQQRAGRDHQRGRVSFATRNS
eukprot:9035767-Prorocentrum_lima.AAC.1